MTDIKDLRAKSQEFVELGKSFMRQHYNVPLPEFVQHIQALQKRLDDYEARVEKLKELEIELVKEDTQGFIHFLKVSGFQIAHKIMTQEGAGR